MQKTEQWYENALFRFYSVVEKWNSAKTEQWYKNNGTLFRFCSVEYGTVVQKTEQWYENTRFRFCSVVEKRNSAKTEQWYKNTEQWYKIHCSVFVPLWKNGTVVQKTDKNLRVPKLVSIRRRSETWAQAEQSKSKRNNRETHI